MEFSKIKISDIGRIVTGKTPKTSIPENYGGNIPFLTPSDNLSNKYVPKTTKTITELGLSEVKNCLLPANSICVSCIGSDLGKVVLTTTPLVTNQQLNSIITAIKEQKTVTVDSIKVLPADTFNVNIIQQKAKPAPKPQQEPLKQPLPNN